MSHISFPAFLRTHTTRNIFCLQLGDWFVLYQLCKNCNPYFFREFIRELAIEIKNRPKKSKSTATLAAASPQSPMTSRSSPPQLGETTITNLTNIGNNGKTTLPREDDGIAV